MKGEQEGSIIVGLDLGTTKVCTIIGEATGTGGVNIIGVGQSPSRGLKKGVVVNIEDTVVSITKAIEDAERMAGTQVTRVFAGIAGGHIKSLNSRGVIAVGRGGEITAEDVDRVIDAAKAVAIPPDREVIHVIPREFLIDDQEGIKEPVGMSGVRLEADVHIVTAAVTSVQNIVKSVSRAGFTTEDIVLQPMASAEATLTNDERELGVALVDVGGGTTDIAVFSEGAIAHTSVIALGGDKVTADIAQGLRTPLAEAEELKKKNGCALIDLVQEGEEVKVPGVGGRGERLLPRKLLTEIIQPRMEEIFDLAARDIRKNGWEDRIGSGVVITGGSSLLPGATQLAEKVFNAPVRLGTPRGITGLVDVVQSPIYATGVGLVLYGLAHHGEGNAIGASERNLFNKVLVRMRQWFNEFF